MENIINKASKVLIINDLFNLIVNDHIAVKLVQQVYVSAFILNKVNENLLIHVSDKDVADYEFLWKTSSNISKFLSPFIVNKDWKTLDLFSYDIIIVHLLEEHLLVNELGKLRRSFPESRIPAIFVITDYNERKISPQIGHKMDTLFNDSVKVYINQKFQHEISDFKSQIKNNFVGFTREDQEYFHRDILEQITLTNELNLSKDVKNIIFLDDYKRRFYIGDSYLWLVNIRRYLFEVYPSADVFVNCRNENRFLDLKNIFDGSWDTNISMNNMEWDEINFADFDLILYQNDLTIPFLSYVKQNYHIAFYKKSIYSFFNTFFRSDLEVPVWNYKNLFNHVTSSRSFIDKILRKKLYSELFISEEERKFADCWFNERGTAKANSVIVFITNASQKEKMLPTKNQMLFIEALILTYNCHILLFDDQHDNMREQINQNLTPEISEKVMISDLDGLRKDLGLVASKYIKAVIGPCTGMMHLANGIYNYFLNKKIIRRDQLPLLLVYTGNLRGITDEYHPKNWWTNTLIKAISGIRVSDGDVSIVPINKLPSNMDDYNRLSVPLEDMSIDSFTNYMISNFPKLNEA